MSFSEMLSKDGAGMAVENSAAFPFRTTSFPNVDLAILAGGKQGLAIVGKRDLSDSLTMT